MPTPRSESAPSNSTPTNSETPSATETSRKTTAEHDARPRCRREALEAALALGSDDRPRRATHADVAERWIVRRARQANTSSERRRRSSGGPGRRTPHAAKRLTGRGSWSRHGPPAAHRHHLRPPDGGLFDRLRRRLAALVPDVRQGGDPSPTRNARRACLDHWRRWGWPSTRPARPLPRAPPRCRPRRPTRYPTPPPPGPLGTPGRERRRECPTGPLVVVGLGTAIRRGDSAGVGNACGVSPTPAPRRPRPSVRGRPGAPGRIRNRGSAPSRPPGPG